MIESEKRRELEVGDLVYPDFVTSTSAFMSSSEIVEMFGRRVMRVANLTPSNGIFRTLHLEGDKHVYSEHLMRRATQEEIDEELWLMRGELAGDKFGL